MPAVLFVASVAREDGTLSALRDARHAQTIRAWAIDTARTTGEAIYITRVTAGESHPCFVVLPNGHVERPAGMAPISAREDCRAEADGMCYCSPCRAARRA